MTNEQYAEWQEYYRATMPRLKLINRVALWLTLPLLALIYFDQWQAWGIGFAIQTGCNLAHYLIGRRLDKRLDWVRAELIRDCAELEAELLRKLPPMGLGQWPEPCCVCRKNPHEPWCPTLVDY